MIFDHDSLRVPSLSMAFLDSVVGVGEPNRGFFLSPPLFVLVQRTYTLTRKMAVRGGEVSLFYALPCPTPLPLQRARQFFFLTDTVSLSVTAFPSW